MLEEDVLDVIRPMRAGLAVFAELMPYARFPTMFKDTQLKAKKEYSDQALITAFQRLTRALWPSTTYWDLTPGNRRNYKPSLTNLYHKRRYHAFFGEYFQILIYLHDERK